MKITFKGKQRVQVPSTADLNVGDLFAFVSPDDDERPSGVCMKTTLGEFVSFEVANAGDDCSFEFTGDGEPVHLLKGALCCEYKQGKDDDC